MSNYTMAPVVNGEKKQMIVKVGDTLPIGTEVDYDGSVVPDGWEVVDDPNTYSTNETRIGTWIDGKPIYRKVVDFTISSTWQDVGTFSNVNFFTKIQLVRKTGGNAYPYYHDSDNYCYAYITTTKTKMIVASSSNENGNAGSLIVEYTKTTD